MSLKMFFFLLLILFLIHDYEQRKRHREYLDRLDEIEERKTLELAKAETADETNEDKEQEALWAYETQQDRIRDTGLKNLTEDELDLMCKEFQVDDALRIHHNYEDGETQKKWDEIIMNRGASTLKEKGKD